MDPLPPGTFRAIDPRGVYKRGSLGVQVMGRRNGAYKITLDLCGFNFGAMPAFWMIETLPLDPLSRGQSGVRRKAEPKRTSDGPLHKEDRKRGRGAGPQGKAGGGLCGVAGWVGSLQYNL